MPPDLALSSTLISSNYPCLELIFMVPKEFEPLKFDCTFAAEEHQENIQSTLVISKSKGPSETVRDIRTSTYQICSIEENTG